MRWTRPRRHAVVLPAALLTGEALTRVTPAATPQPLRVIVESSSHKQIWDQAWFGPLLGVVVGAALTAGAELLRRRADRDRATKERKAAERLARFDREYDRAKDAAKAVEQSVANLTALLSVQADLADIPADVAKALPVDGNGVRDRVVADRAAALGARVAAISGSGALQEGQRATLIARVHADAVALLPDLQAEATARAGDLADMDANGRAEAEREAEQLRGSP